MVLHLSLEGCSQAREFCGSLISSMYICVHILVHVYIYTVYITYHTHAHVLVLFIYMYMYIVCTSVCVFCPVFVYGGGCCRKEGMH